MKMKSFTMLIIMIVKNNRSTHFSLILNPITDTDSSKVHKNVKKKNVDCFEATLLATNNERIRRPKKVYCYVSPKQLTVKEFYLKVIPKRLHTFRVCPATKVSSQNRALHNIKIYQFSNLRDCVV